MPNYLIILLMILAAPLTAQADTAGDWKICESDDDDAAIVACTRLIDKGNLKSKQRAMAYYNRGVSNKAKGNVDRAFADYSKAIEADPQHAKALNNRCDIHWSRGDNDRAIADCTQAIEVDPSYAFAYNNRGNAYSDKGLSDRAMADYAKAIELNPKYVKAFNNRCDEYWRRGDNDRAIADCTRAVELDPKYSKAYSNRAIALRSKGETQRAAGDFAKALTLEPENARYARGIGVARFDGGDWRGAADALKRAVKMKDDAYAMLYRYLARTRAGEAAEDELGADASRLEEGTWGHTLTEVYTGKRTPSAALEAAKGDGERCEAAFYIGAWQAAKGIRTEAESRLRSAVEICRKTVLEHPSAVAELKRLKGGGSVQPQPQPQPQPQRRVSPGESNSSRD